MGYVFKHKALFDATKVCTFDQLLGGTEVTRHLSFDNDEGNGLCESMPYSASKFALQIGCQRLQRWHR